MAAATLTSKGQVTIPISVRKDLDLMPGSMLDFIANADGSWKIVKRQRSILELAGIIKRTEKTVSIDEMTHKAKQQVGKRFLESF